jgi:F0F1-type ATP synthase membrane subunit b/b'
MKATPLIAALAAIVVAVPAAQAQGRYKRDIPDSLLKHSKITESAAAEAKESADEAKVAKEKAAKTKKKP